MAAVLVLKEGEITCHFAVQHQQMELVAKRDFEAGEQVCFVTLNFSICLIQFAWLETEKAPEYVSRGPDVVTNRFTLTWCHFVI